MPGGALDRAAHKDVKERLEKQGCSKEEYEELCEGQEDSDECPKACRL